MKLTKRESALLRRALDKASAPAEADMAAKAFIASLRARGIDGYDFLRVDGAKPAGRQPEAPTQPPAATPQPPFGGWPNQWRNAEAQASEAAQAQAWQNYYANQQAQAQNTAWEQTFNAGMANAEPHEPNPPEEPKRENIWKRVWNFVKHGCEIPLKK